MKVDAAPGDQYPHRYSVAWDHIVSSLRGVFILKKEDVR